MDRYQDCDGQEAHRLSDIRAFDEPERPTQRPSRSSYCWPKVPADEWEFKAENFVPYTPGILDRLMALVKEVELQETKMALLNTISIIVERLEHNVGIIKIWSVP
jgi:hypothetical protein